MKLLICIDDTDSLDKSISTGRIAEIIIDEIEKEHLGKCEAVTRHQLLRHEDIPFTSHNSSMCFRASIDACNYEKVVKKTIQLLYQYQAAGSDPGLCVVKEEELDNPELLISYGYSAQEKILTKEEAYSLATKLKIHLTEHGGTGLGVIGALAGAGLRLSGEDGEFKGTVKLGKEGTLVSIGDLEEYPFIDEVRMLNGDPMDRGKPVILGAKYKTILRNGKAIFLIDDAPEQGENYYRSCTKKEIRSYGR